MGILKWVAATIALAATGGAALHAQYRGTEEPAYDVWRLEDF